MKHARWALLWPVLWACNRGAAPDAAPSAAAASVSASPVRVTVEEVSWDKAAALIRKQGVITALPTRDRRVFLTSETGSLVTTAPSDDALAKLLEEADPKHERIGTTHHYLEHQEVPWPRADEILRGGKAYIVEENAARRVFITTVEPELRYVAFAPDGLDLRALIDEIRQRPIMTKHFRYREVPWHEVAALIRAKKASVSAMHGKRVALKDARDGNILTYEPEQDAAVQLIDAVDPGGKMLLSIE